jgi:iron complex outermembrane recepter protein
MMINLRASLLMGAPLVVLCAAAPRPVQAQQAPAQPDSTSPLLLEEIIVTAEKMGSGRPLQQVPIAITGVDAEQIQTSHMVNVQDVGRMAPDVYLDTSGTLMGTAAFTIRGVGERTSTASIDPAVAASQDGMVLSLQTGLSGLSTFDTQSVQILRGPQGVLEGVGAAGGAVEFATPLPNSSFRATSSVTAGNFNLIGATNVVEGPLSDNLLAKVAIYEQHVAGYYQNTTDEGTYQKTAANPTGTEPQHPTGLVAGTQTFIIKPTFLLTLSDDLKLKVFAQFESDIDGGSASEAINPNPAPGGAPKYLTTFGYTPTWQPYQTNIGTPGYTHIFEEHLIGQLDWTLGLGTWTTIAALRNVDFYSIYDNAGSPFNVILVNTTEQNRQGSIESRYSARVSDRLSYVVGTYEFADNLPVTIVNGTNQAELGKPLLLPSNINSSLNLDNQLIQYNQKTEMAAVFGNVDYRLLEKLTLSAGVRFQYEHKNFDIQPGANAAGVVYCTPGTLNNCPTTYYDPAKSWTITTPRAVLSYQATQDILAYASYAKGWGAGNFNGSPSTLGAALIAANPETVNNYELGFKSEWLDHRFRANIAVYDEVFDNIQRTAITSLNGAHVSTLLNAATAKIRGAEVELTALPFDGFKLFANGGAVFAKYDSFDQAVAPNAYNPTEPLTELSFNNVPKWTTDGGFAYTFRPTHSGGDFELASDYAWRSRQFGDFNNTPQAILPAYGLLQASLSFTKGPWSVSLWGRNLRNTFYAEAVQLASGWTLYPGQPRTYGLTGTLKFE